MPRASAAQRAITLFDERIPVAYNDWLAMGEELRAQSFTMAGIWNESFLEELQDSITAAMEGKLPFEQWYPIAQQIVAKYGGLVHVAVKDEAGLMAPSYARMVFNVATEGAYAKGRYVSMFAAKRVSSHPYVTYCTMQDDRVRDAHAELEGVVFDKNDETARPLFPPSDFNCRCWLEDATADSVDPEDIADGSEFPRPPGDWNVDRIKELVPDVYAKTFGGA